MSKHMKDSGIPWIGQIPANWNIHRVKYHFQHNKRIVGIHASEYERLALTMHGVIKRSKEDNDGLQPEDFASYQILRRNELVFKLIDLQNISTSRVGLSPYEGLVSPAYIILHASSASCPKYAYYFFLFMWLDAIFNSLGDAGVRSSLNAGDLLNLPIIVPSLPEQRKIVEYLDKKCADVEGLSSNIQKQIEALEQYKRAVITETVTKGLNPSVPMKDSGIPWVGQSPAHWGIKRIKFCCELSPKFHNRLSPNTLVSFLPMECVKQGFLVIEKEAELQDVKNGYTYFRENDIIMAKVTPCFENGNIAIAKGLLNNVGFGSSELYVFRPHKISVPFLFYFLQNTIFKNQAQSVMYGTGGLKRVPSEFIKNYQFACPPQSEQQAIAEYLDNKCSKIDTIIQDKQQQLEKLEQYKKAIIFEYVTGKKQVPEA